MPILSGWIIGDLGVATTQEEVLENLKRRPWYARERVARPSVEGEVSPTRATKSPAREQQAAPLTESAMEDVKQQAAPLTESAMEDVKATPARAEERPRGGRLEEMESEGTTDDGETESDVSAPETTPETTPKVVLPAAPQGVEGLNYMCATCGKRVRDRKSLTRHVSVAHAAAYVGFQCPVCPAALPSDRRTNFRRHLERSHGYTRTQAEELTAATQPTTIQGPNSDGSLPATPETRTLVSRVPTSQETASPSTRVVQLRRVEAASSVTPRSRQTRPKRPHTPAAATRTPAAVTKTPTAAAAEDMVTRAQYQDIVLEVHRARSQTAAAARENEELRARLRAETEQREAKARQSDLLYQEVKRLTADRNRWMEEARAAGSSSARP